MFILVCTVFLYLPFSLAVSTDDLHAYYSFDSDCLTDDHASYTGTNVGATNTASGKLNNGCDFERSESDRISINSLATADLFKDPFSISAWAKIETVNDGEYQYLVSIIDSDQDPYGVMGLQDNGDNHFYTSEINALNVVQEATNRRADTSWHFLVMTIDTDGKITSFYIDNVDIGSSTSSTVSFDGVTDYFCIGCLHWSSYLHHFDGIIDEFGVWSKELTPTEINDLYNSGDGISYPFSVVTEGSLTLNTELVNNTESTANPFSFVFNGTVADTTDIWNVSFYINGSLYQTINNVALNNTNYQYKN